MEGIYCNFCYTSFKAGRRYLYVQQINALVLNTGICLFDRLIDLDSPKCVLFKYMCID